MSFKTCPRYNVEEVPEDPAISMTASLKKENSLEICAKVCPTSSQIEAISPPVHWDKGGDQDGGDGD